MQEISPDQSLIEYPCDFPIKVMGLSHVDFQQTIGSMVMAMVPGFDPQTIQSRPSKNGKYTGLTLVVRVHSRTELDAVYQALHAHAMVSVVL